MKKKILIFYCSLLFFTSLKIHAQLESHLIDEQAWLKGNFVEIGVNKKGVFGNNTANRPPNFHDNRETTNFLFGFIANPKMDDWIDYDGDFFTPGDPEEGFTLEINGANFSNNNAIGLNDILGEITNTGIIESGCFEDVAKIDWVGEVNDVQIRRSYSITENGLFIQMITSISNLSSEVKNDVYFMHNLDPDNNVTLTGFYETDLEVISQPSTINDIALVKATQTPSTSSTIDADGSAISFYANDARARVTYGGFSNRNASSIWNGTGSGYTSTTGLSTYADLAISIAFQLGDIEPSETKSFVYYYILEEVDETFVPIIVNTSITNPSTCNGNDGSILFSGLDEGEDYIVSYKKDGISIPSNTYTANSIGNIEITDLNVALYSDFVIEHNSCTTILNIEHQLTDPQKPVLVLSKMDPSDCDGTNGQLILADLIANEDIEFSYDIDGISIPLSIQSTNENGELIFTDLSNADYSNFNLRYVNTNCNAFFPDTITLDGTFPIILSSNVPEQFFCDEDFDFVTEIDLTNIDSIILGSLSSLDYTITYHTSQDNATNSISISKTNYLTNGNNFNLFFRMENNTTGCFETDSFLVTINTPVNFQMNDGFLCLLADGSLDPDYNLPLNTGLDPSVYAFEWFLNDNPLGSFSSGIIAEDEGRYKVTVTTIATGCSIDKEVEVFPSGKPTSHELTLESGIFTDFYSVKIYATGLGSYEYRFNNRPYQDSSLLQGVPTGDHLFYINDINGCGEIEIEKLVIEYPRFFTPNYDSVNDFWQVKGLESLRNPIIHIYNRLGKLIKILPKDSIGWDGTYNGNTIVSNDYWFVIYYENENGTSKKFQGHFALLR